MKPKELFQKLLIASGLQISGKRIVIASIIFLLCFGVSIPLFHISFTNKETESISADSGTLEASSAFSDDSILYQSFFLKGHGKLESVSIPFATYNNTITVPSVIVSICDKRHSYLFQKEIPMTEIQDNVKYVLNTNGLELDGYSRYYVVIQAYRPNGDSDITPSVWMGKNNSLNDTLYQRDQIVQDKALALEYQYQRLPIGITGILTYLCLFLIIMLFCFFNKNQLRYIPIILFLMISLLLFVRIWTVGDALNMTLSNMTYARTTCVILIVLLLSSGAVGGVLIKKQKIPAAPKGKLNDKTKIFSYLVSGCLAVLLLFSVQLIIASNLYHKIGWDVSSCYRIATNMLKDGRVNHGNYLNFYPNNKMLIITMMKIIELTGNVSDAQNWWAIIVCNIISIDAAIILAYFVCKRIFGHGCAILSTIFSVIIFGLSGWIVVPYTDTLTAWIPLTILLLILQGETAKKKPAIRYTCFVLAGFFSGLGYFCKPQCIIVLIAIGLVQCVISIIKKDIWKPLSYLWVAGGIIVGIIFFDETALDTFKNNVKQNYSVPMEHFVMMGAGEYPSSTSIGGYCNADVVFTYARGKENLDMMKKRCRKELTRRLDNYGIAGFITHLRDKAVWILGDGSFFWQEEGTFWADDYSYKEGNTLQQSIREFYMGEKGGYDNEKKMNHFGVRTGIWFFILLCCLIPVASCDKENQKYKYIIILSILGCIAFTMLFEGRARYLINYLPFFCMFAAANMLETGRKISKMIATPPKWS